MRKKWKSAAARRMREFTGKATVEAATIEIGRRLTAGQDLPPTNLEAIFPRVAIHRCYPAPELSFAGELRLAEDGFEIAYCESESTTRRRFTIAHEIAHAVFERTGPHCPRRGQELEQICNLIASQILIPHDSLRASVGETLTLARLSQLAAIYETSLTSMAIRCAHDFGMIATETENEEVTWFNCPMTANVVSPQAQLQKLAQLAGDERAGSILCTLELRRSAAEKLMQWTRTGEDRRLFVFVDPPAV